jgi:superfamily II DNA/RNA helicase
MTPDKAQELFQILEKSGSIAQNAQAQGSARYIKLSVHEPLSIIRQTRFNPNLNEQLDSMAFSYLSIGCCFLENKASNKYETAFKAIEKGAQLLEYNHFYEANRHSHSRYYILIAALAYYAASQYSKAFILLTKVEEGEETLEYTMQIGKMTSLFLKKTHDELTEVLNNILLDDDYITETEEDENIDARIHAFLFAKAMANLLEYLRTGNDAALSSAYEILDDLQTLLMIESEPSGWWVVRLFKIIALGFKDNSLWATIPPKIIGGDRLLIKRFVNSLIYRDNPIVELFVSQRQALPKVLSNEGAVVSLPTSSGKTRIAEIAILQCLSQDPEAKVLYLAPFRSLSLEVEAVLDKSFGNLGIEVSYLYGKSGLSKIDKSLIDASRILIATPEKAKAIFRANDEIASKIQLLIIDEGHLLDESERFVRNELFIEELRYHIHNRGGKIILLSAVLPNTEDIARWIAHSENQVAKSTWRPSTQRLGFLQFVKANKTIKIQNLFGEESKVIQEKIVDIEWFTDATSKPFNKRFIEPFELSRTITKSKTQIQFFPNNKQEAVAATALKMTSIGSVLVFVGKTDSVLNYASSVLIAMGRFPEAHTWKNTQDWEVFKLACLEYYGLNSQILKLATYGILCHHAKLPADIRFSTENLMRNGKPKIIVATSTLAQGVNLGVSSVIITGAYVAGKQLEKRDFWNIAGRAGRAFVDTEGKILFAIDKIETKDNTRLKITNNEDLGKGYFSQNAINEAYSGLLHHLNRISDIAVKNGINFEILLGLISENDFSKLHTPPDTPSVSEVFDYMDDTLLALNITFESFDIDNSDWVDTHFRTSLAAIQAEKHSTFNTDNVLDFLKARSKAVKNLAGESNKWQQITGMSLPFRSATKLRELSDDIKNQIVVFQNSAKQSSDWIELLENLEKIILQLPSTAFQSKYAKDVNLKSIREKWLSGLKIEEKEVEVVTKYFSYPVAWALSSMAQQLALEETEMSSILESLALFCEIGVSDEMAAKVYLCGLRSRQAAIELSQKLNTPQYENLNLKELTKEIVQNEVLLAMGCSDMTIQWLNILVNQFRRKNENKLTEYLNFELPEGAITAKSDLLYLRLLDKQIFLCNLDYSEKILYTPTMLINEKDIRKSKVYFQRMDDKWKLQIR